MKPWKLVLGAGVACVACCAAPIISGMAALGIGSGLLAAGAGALSAYAESWLPLVAGGVAVAAVAGTMAWKRKRPAEPATERGCSSSPEAAPACGTLHLAPKIRT
jgi:hypothetical protein